MLLSVEGDPSMLTNCWTLPSSNVKHERTRQVTNWVNRNNLKYISWKVAHAPSSVHPLSAPLLSCQSASLLFCLQSWWEQGFTHFFILPYCLRNTNAYAFMCTYTVHILFLLTAQGPKNPGYLFVILMSKFLFDWHLWEDTVHALHFAGMTISLGSSCWKGPHEVI